MSIVERSWTASFSPYRYIRQVPYEQIYDVVRYVMWRWGRLHWLRIDNGSPFGDPTRQALSILNLCLAAHGIRCKVNPPRTPTRNAKVERNQGTTFRWSEPEKCENYLVFQQRLDQVIVEQREHYPTRVCKGQTRMAAFPELCSNPAQFNPDDFELHRVYHLLAQGRWKRMVSDRGSVNLFWQYYQLGRSKRGQTVFASLNQETMHWDFFCPKGNKISSLPIKPFTEEQLKRGDKSKMPSKKG